MSEHNGPAWCDAACKCGAQVALTCARSKWHHGTRHTITQNNGQAYSTFGRLKSAKTGHRPPARPG